MSLKHGPTVNFKGETHGNETHVSTANPDTRLYKKSEGDKSQLTFFDHTLMEIQHALVVDVQVTPATGASERETAKAMIEPTATQPGSTVGDDRGYDAQSFVEDLRKLKVTPYLAPNANRNVIDRRTTRHDGYRQGLKARMRFEEVFDRAKTVCPPRQAKFLGLQKLMAQRRC